METSRAEQVMSFKIQNTVTPLARATRSLGERTILPPKKRRVILVILVQQNWEQRLVHLCHHQQVTHLKAEKKFKGYKPAEYRPNTPTVSLA